MSWAETKKINKNMFKPLDELIIEKTNILVQHVTFSFKEEEYQSEKYATINEVDISRSIIVPTTSGSPIRTITGGYRFGSASYSFANSTSVKCKCSLLADYEASAMVITFGATVEGAE